MIGHRARAKCPYEYVPEMGEWPYSGDSKKTVPRFDRPLKFDRRRMEYRSAVLAGRAYACRCREPIRPAQATIRYSWMRPPK
jgi:hypothetical protein